MSQYTEVTVGLDERSYPLTIGSGVLANTEYLTSIVDGIKPSRIVVITNSFIQKQYFHHLEQLEQSLLCMTLDDGEQYKNWQSLQSIYDFLLENYCGRDTLLCALGGGVVGDIAGFAAATYQRGINYLQIPTTLLAQVDSSVGGKTAINHPLGKNMIGAFYQPSQVLIDTDTLNSLPIEQLCAGLAEVIKYALINDPDFFIWLEQNMDALLDKNQYALHQSTLHHAIETSCRHKVAIVASDEQEHGIRALLNLGHSFGHVIERFTGYGTWLHGQAVAAGMVCAARVSQQLGYIPAEEVQRIISLIARAHLPTELPEGLNAETMVSLLQLDKKNRNNSLRLVLMRGIGKSFITDSVQADELKSILTSL